MYPGIREVSAEKDFSLKVVFENDEKRILDMRPYLDFGIFMRIRDFEKFRRVRVVFDTIEWDENVDLDPEFIYEKSSPLRD